jgi:hypothetical protein
MPHTHFDFLELFFALWGMKPFSVAVWLIPPHSLLLSHFLPCPEGQWHKLPLSFFSLPIFTSFILRLDSEIFRHLF